MRIDTNELVRRRRDADLKQYQLAEAAGISKSHMSDLEAGKYQPTLATLGRIAAALGCELSDLIVRAECA